jgi:large subunit ribosomal protein L22
MIEGRATARYVRTSAQKAGLVMDLIRGQNVDLALSTLRFARKRIARDIEKVLRSAVANAQQKEGASGEVDRMIVSSCYADQGPSQKRVRPAPMGRAFQIIKRTAHLTVHVIERAEVVKRAPEAGTQARKTATKRTARKTTARSTKGKTTSATKKSAATQSTD